MPPNSETPSTTATVAPSSTPKRQPPTLTAAAKQRSRAGMQALARHWVATSNYMVRTGDSRPFLALSTSACDWCTGIAKVYADVYKAGGSYSGDVDAIITKFTLTDFSGAASGYVEFYTSTPSYFKTPKAGAQEQQVAPATLAYTLNMDYVGGRWVIRHASWIELPGNSK
jgi:hypothetical protein